MNKFGIIILIIFVLSVTTFIFYNKKDNNENLNQYENSNNTVNREDTQKDFDVKMIEEIEKFSDIPTPDYILFYYEGEEIRFDNGTKEFEKILELNKKRDSGEFIGTKGVVNIENYKKIKMLEYVYEGYGSIYFELSTEEEMERLYGWIALGNSELPVRPKYEGLYPADELMEYLNNCKN